MAFLELPSWRMLQNGVSTKRPEQSYKLKNRAIFSIKIANLGFLWNSRKSVDFASQ